MSGYHYCAYCKKSPANGGKCESAVENEIFCDSYYFDARFDPRPLPDKEPTETYFRHREYFNPEEVQKCNWK